MPIPSILWLIALIALLVLEAATVGLVSLWFALAMLAETTGGDSQQEILDAQLHLTGGATC